MELDQPPPAAYTIHVDGGWETVDADFATAFQEQRHPANCCGSTGIAIVPTDPDWMQKGTTLITLSDGAQIGSQPAQRRQRHHDRPRDLRRYPPTRQQRQPAIPIRPRSFQGRLQRARDRQASGHAQRRTRLPSHALGHTLRQLRRDLQRAEHHPAHRLKLPPAYRRQGRRPRPALHAAGRPAHLFRRTLHQRGAKQRLRPRRGGQHQ